MLKRLVGAALLACAGLGLTACDSLPKEVEQRAATLENNIDGLTPRLEANRESFQAVQSGNEWAFFAPYAEREDWEGKFAEAETSIRGLDQTYESQVGTLLDADRSEDAARTRTAIDAVRSQYQTTLDLVNYVPARMTLLREGFENADEWLSSSEVLAGTAETIVSNLQPVKNTAKSRFPNRADDIETRYAPIGTLADEIAAAYAVVQTQHALHEASSEDVDYAAFADAYTTIREGTVRLAELRDTYQSAIESLSRNYSLILSDMRMEYWVTPQQETWCNYVDCRTDTNTFPARAVSKEQFEAMTSREELTEAQVRDLGLDPNNGLGGSRNGTSWYLNDWEIKYFHRYTEVDGSNVNQRGWEEVDEEEFGARADDFGMAILTKRIGQFEDEALREAIPPGMDMVGDPRYGRWESDGQGGQRWSFLETYAMYHLLFGGNDRYYYSRSDYNSYRNWRDRDNRGSGWYGTSSRPTYGSNGSQTTRSAAYRSSPFARNGGSQAVPQSVRNAGSSSRSRGPGGRGK